MASVVFGFAGQAVGGFFGGPLGAKIGGFIGQAVGGLIDNSLFGGTKQEGPRLEDKRVQVSTYGVTLPVVYGPENRIAGLVIWTSGLIETATKTKQGGKGGPSVSVTEYSYRVSFALALSDRRGVGVAKVWANQKLIFDRDGTGSPPVTETLFRSLTFYPGSATQNPDPTIESYLGVGETPAYRHTAYMVIEDLQLADFGNRLPMIEVLYEADTSISLSRVVADLCRRSGASMNDISTSALPIANVRGYVIAGSSRGADAIQPLALAYSFDAAEQGGSLRFIRRGLGPKGVIEADDMGAYQGFDTEVPEPIRFDLMPPFNLPREAVVNFSDPARDYQKSSQVSRRQFGDADSNLSYDLPVVLDADSAIRLADRMLYESHTSRRTAEWTTNLKWRQAKPGDTYFVPSPAGLTLVRLTRALRGVNGMIQMQSRADAPDIYRSTAFGVGAAIPEQIIAGIPDIEVILLDIPLLLDADNNNAEGFYFGVSALSSGWRGADVQRALSPTDAFTSMGTQGRELIVGQGETNLTAIPAGFNSATDWDTTSSLKVRLRRADMELETLTDAEVLAGGNAAYIGPASGTGGEIIQFANATLQGDGSYILTRLRRGQKGTEFLANAHGLGQRFVLLEPGALLRANFGFGDLNQARTYRAVAVFQSPDEAPLYTFTNTGVGLRPYAPINLTSAGTSPPSDIVLTWTRRSRIGGSLIPPPLAEESERYVLRIMNASGTTIVRAVDLTAPTFTYTAAMQTADFGAPQTSLRWRVAQVSATYGPGIFAEDSGPV